MPLRSKAQQRFMFAAEARGELTEGTAREWAHHTPNIKSLPEHVGGKKKAGFGGALKGTMMLARPLMNAMRPAAPALKTPARPPVAQAPAPMKQANNPGLLDQLVAQLVAKGRTDAAQAVAKAFGDFHNKAVHDAASAGGATAGGGIGGLLGGLGGLLGARFGLNKIPGNPASKLLRFIGQHSAKLQGAGAAAGGLAGGLAGRGVGGAMGGLARPGKYDFDKATVDKIVGSVNNVPKVTGVAIGTEKVVPGEPVKPTLPAPVKKANADMFWPLMALGGVAGAGGLIGAGQRPTRPVRGAVEGGMAGGMGLAGMLPGAALGGLAGLAGADAMNVPQTAGSGAMQYSPTAGLALLGMLAGGGLGGYYGSRLGRSMGRGVNALTGDDRSDLEADQMMM